MAAPTAATVDGVLVAGTSTSAEGVLAGDWWDAIALDGQRLALVVADTSGHGTGAVLTALRTRDLLRAGLASGLEPARAMTMALGGIGDDGNFVTAFLCVIDPVNHNLTYCNAGHQPPVIVTPDKETVICGGTGPLLSSLGGEWTDQVVDFSPGTLLVAYTDGLIEGTSPSGGDLTADDLGRIIRALDAPVRKDPTEVLNRVVSHIREHASAWHRDDVTAVVAGCPGMAL